MGRNSVSVTRVVGSKEWILDQILVTDEEILEIMGCFAYSHLPNNLQSVSMPIARLAMNMCKVVPENFMLKDGLNSLLKAKDSFVRGCLEDK